MCRRSKFISPYVLELFFWSSYLPTCILQHSHSVVARRIHRRIAGRCVGCQGAVITNADIVAIRVDTGIRYHSATDSADDSQ